MRNLELLYSKKSILDIHDAQFLLLDSNEKGDLKYVANNDCVFLLKEDAIEVIAEVPKIVGAEYLALDHEVCIASEVGEVLLINPDTREQREGTFCEVGLECMTWSPDQEVVVFVTKAHNVVVMTCTFDLLEEHSLSIEDEDRDQFMNLGWGKKETQFHGSEGKAAAQKCNEIQSPTQIEESDVKVNITWRGDGKYFAVSFFNPVVGRMFKVFDKEGKLNYTSEKSMNLYSPIVWRPSGTWVAVPQSLPNKCVIALFEKNGLKHREIILPFLFDFECVIDLKWSLDSEILIIETLEKEKRKNNLYLYTIRNYHWYLKQKLTFNFDDRISILNWDQRMGEEKRLHIISKSGVYLVYKWHWTIARSIQGVVAVIDGNKLLINDFEKTVIPPPMCNQELLYDVSVNLCSFSKDILYAFDQNLVLHVNDGNSKYTFRPALPLMDTYPLLFGSMVLISNDCFLAKSFTANGCTPLYQCKFSFAEKTYSIEKEWSINGAVISYITVNKSDDKTIKLYLQTENGFISEVNIDIESKLMDIKQSYHLNDYIDSILDYSLLNPNNFLSLTRNKCFYIDDKIVANDVTSICSTGNKYLAFTKLKSLHFLRYSDMKVFGERKIERGATLVTSVFNEISPKIILQMPRGNLETICPRIFSFDVLSNLLNEKRYYKAIDMLRKQRINLNILCDHNISEFIIDLEVFLDEITDTNWLNLFLSELRNEDFTRSMYAEYYTTKKENTDGDLLNNFNIKNKVSFICEKLCDCMEKRSLQRDRFRLPILTAYVRMGNIKRALEIVWQDKKNERYNVQQNSADDSLKYLLYLVDVNDLYNIALSTYDFGLVLFVVQKSQKDPKEYLPFLNELKKLEVNYRHFRIDEYIKVYDKALTHISKCGTERFPEALAFIKRHQLYGQALQCNWTDVDFLHQINLAFGDYLRGKGKHGNASIMYERGGNYNQAILSAKHVLDWQRVLKLVQTDVDTKKDIVALSLVPLLIEKRKYDEAYYLQKTYGKDFSEALNILLNGKLFLKAIYECRQREDVAETERLVDSIVAPALLSYLESFSLSLSQDFDHIINYKNRLETLRKEFQNRNTDSLNGIDSIEQADMMSDTTSMNSSRYTYASSRLTNKTFRSSKNRRKHERKMFSLKPGNPFEDIAIIDMLHGHLTKFIDQQQHVHDVCKALLELNQFDREAAKVQKMYKDYLQIVKSTINEIWTIDMMSATPKELANGSTLEWSEYMQLKNEQRYTLLEPLKRLPPQVNCMEWEHEILMGQS